MLQLVLGRDCWVVSVLLTSTLAQSCQSSATSIFQPPPSHRATTSSHHARPSGVFRCRSDGLECAAWRPPRPAAQCRQFQEDAKYASVSECPWTLSALEALRNALYKFKTYLLTYTRQGTWFLKHLKIFIVPLKYLLNFSLLFSKFFLKYSEDVFDSLHHFILDVFCFFYNLMYLY